MSEGARDEDKRAAAARAVELVEEGMVVGLGTGSTATHFVDLLGERVRAGLRIRGLPTSTRTREQATRLGIPLIGFGDTDRIDLTVDGADQLDPQLRLVKGGGGALLHEKIVAGASERMVVIVDGAKLAPVLGSYPLPVEVIPFGWQVVQRRIAALGGRPSLRQTGSGTPFVTDEGNHILDCPFGRIDEPEKLHAELKRIPGVVEHGLFLGMCELAIVAERGAVRLVRPA